MSKQVNVKSKKASRLGRGLGSLIGENTKVDVFSGASNVFDNVEMAEQRPETPKAIKEGFIEEKKPVQNLTQKKPTEKLVEKVVVAAPQVPAESRIWKVEIANVFPNPRQPRKEFAKQALEELSNSIGQKGILQPIVCRKTAENKFEIIAGERRWRAAQAAGLHQVPVILKETSNQEALELALIENIQRQDLNPLEEAEAYNHLMQTYDLTQQQLAEKMGKERVTVANVLRLINLGPEVKQLLREQKIFLGQAKVLLSVSDFKVQKKLAFKVAKDKLSVRATEKLIKKYQNKPLEVESLDMQVDLTQQKLVKQLAEKMQKLLGSKVSIDYNNGKGKFNMYFYSDAEMNSLAEKVENVLSR